MNQNEKKMLTPEDVSQMYSVSKGTLGNWRCNRTGPRFFKVGKKKILYKLEDIQKFFESQPVITN